jgi:hypothetical protein
MASPHLNGVVALMRQANQNLSVEQIKEIIYQTAYDLGDPGEDNDYGWGMVDAYEAVLHTSEPPCPPMIEGPNDGIEGASYDFTFMSEDPECGDIYYMIDCDDGSPCEWIGPYASGEEIIVSHIWNDIGTFGIIAKAKDDNYVESEWSEPHNISIVENQYPVKVVINGQKWGFGGVDYEFTFISTDADGHDIYYRINWDDENDTGYIGPYCTGETLTLSHSWKQKGEYFIKAWAKDTLDGESQQSSYKIVILTNKNKEKSIIFNVILEHLIKNFPLLNHMLQNLI